MNNYKLISLIIIIIFFFHLSLYLAELELSVSGTPLLSDISDSDVFTDDLQTEKHTDVPVIKSLQADLDAAAQESL